MRRHLKALLVAATLATIANPAAAHRQWLLPSATVLSGEDPWVSFDGASSNDLFYADHRPMNLSTVKVWAPDGSEAAIQNGSTGQYRSVFDVKLDKPGTWKIGTQMSNLTGTFKVNGEERRVGGRPGGMAPGGGPGGAGGPAPGQGPQIVSASDIPANATDVKLTEMSSRNEVFVTSGEPTTTLFKSTGKGLEFVPVTHPNELVSNEPASFRFLVDGKPAANLKVSVIPGGKRYRDGEDGIDVTTGADGVAKINWPMAGMYWLNATVTDTNVTDPRATSRRLSYTTTLEVMAP
jgi:uncharacterized GH25 family protein